MPDLSKEAYDAVTKFGQLLKRVPDPCTNRRLGKDSEVKFPVKAKFPPPRTCINKGMLTVVKGPPVLTKKALFMVLSKGKDNESSKGIVTPVVHVSHDTSSGNDIAVSSGEF